MSNFRSIPLVLSGSGADMRRVTPAEELGLAANAEYITVTQYPVLNFGADSARNYYGSIDRFGTRAADSDMVSIGSFTDTFYAQAVGTHPATSLSTSTTTTPLFQCEDSTDAQHPFLVYPTTTGDFRNRIIALDSDGDIRELDSAQTIAFGKRLLEHTLSNELVGAFRIGTTNPTNGTWEKWNTDAYTDTTSSALTNYHVFRKIANASSENLTAPNCLSLRDEVSSIVDDTGTAEERGSSDITQMFFEQSVALSAATLLARKHSELGKMVLLPSTQTPASTGETGTWQTRGSVVDTVNTTENIQYTSEYFTSISRTEPFVGSRQFVNNGPNGDRYTRYRNSTLPDDFVGQRDAPYAGFRTNFQNGRNVQWAGNRYSTADYAGVRDFANFYVSTRQYAGKRFFGKDYVGPRQYGGTRSYSNQVEGSFAGDRNYADQFGGFRPVILPQAYAGDRDFTSYRVGAGVSSFYRPNEAYAVFVGDRGPFSGVRYRGMQDPIFPQYPQPGKFTGPRIHYKSGTYDFAGVRKQDPQLQNGAFTGIRYTTIFGNFGGERHPDGTPPLFNTPFGGLREVSVRVQPEQRTGPDQPFAGTRTYPITRVSGDLPFGGDREHPTQRFEAITTPETFIGPRQFGKDYVGPRDDTFAGTRFANYVGSYIGQYTAPYIRDYIGQFSTQYTGQTLTNIASVFETYTLYCKVSES